MDEVSVELVFSKVFPQNGAKCRLVEEVLVILEVYTGLPLNPFYDLQALQFGGLLKDVVQEKGSKTWQYVFGWIRIFFRLSLFIALP